MKPANPSDISVIYDFFLKNIKIYLITILLSLVTILALTFVDSKSKRIQSTKIYSLIPQTFLSNNNYSHVSSQEYFKNFVLTDLRNTLSKSGEVFHEIKYGENKNCFDLEIDLSNPEIIKASTITSDEKLSVKCFDKLESLIIVRKELFFKEFKEELEQYINEIDIKTNEFDKYSKNFIDEVIKNPNKFSDLDKQLTRLYNDIVLNRFVIAQGKMLLSFIEKKELILINSSKSELKYLDSITSYLFIFSFFFVVATILGLLRK